MGNCLKSPTSDDISLLHESQSDRASFGEGTEPDQEPPPPYQVGEGVCWGRGVRGVEAALAEIVGASGLSVTVPGLGNTRPERHWTPLGLGLSVIDPIVSVGGILHLPSSSVGMILLSLSSGLRVCDYIPLASDWWLDCGVRK